MVEEWDSGWQVLDQHTAILRTPLARLPRHRPPIAGDRMSFEWQGHEILWHVDRVQIVGEQLIAYCHRIDEEGERL